MRITELTLSSDRRRSLLNLRTTWFSQPVAATSPMWRYGLLTVVVLFTLNALIQSLTVPVFEGSDEQRHYAYARYLVNHRQMPPIIDDGNASYITYKVGQEASQPPLYYLAVALVTAPVSQADDVTRFVNLNPFNSGNDFVGHGLDNHNVFLHGSEGDFPYKGAALAVHLGRLLSVAAGVGTVLAVWAIGRAFAPGRPGLALLATALFASVPGIIYIFSMITNDAAVILFDTLGLFVAVKIAHAGPRSRLAILGGVVSGAATLSKLNGAWIIGVVGVAFIGATLIESGHSRPHLLALLKKAFPLLAISFGTWLLVCGWWFLYGQLAAGDPLGFSIHGLAGAAAYKQPPLYFLRDIGYELAQWDRTTWYSPAWAILTGPAWVYAVFRYVYLAGLVAAYIKAALWLMSYRRNGPDNSIKALQIICILLAILLTLVGAFLWLLTGPWRLGRLLYIGFGGMACLAAIGLLWMASSLRYLRLPIWAPRVALAGVIFVTQATAWYSTGFTLTALNPHGQFSPTAADIGRTQFTYLDPRDGKTSVAGLIGFRAHTDDFRTPTAVQVDLCWKSYGFTAHDYAYSAELVGPGDVAIGTRHSYHGLGSYPLVRWRPGEAFCDQTSIVLLDAAVDRPRAYNLVVTLFPLLSSAYDVGLPLPVIDAANKSAYPIIGRVRVAPPSMPIVTPTYRLGDIAGLVSSSIQMLPGRKLDVTLRWLALEQSTIDARVLLQVVDQDSGNVIAQDDHQPDAGWFPTNYWQTGDVVDDAFQVTLPSDVSMDRLRLGVQMVDAKTLLKLQVFEARTGERTHDDMIPLDP